MMIVDYRNRKVTLERATGPAFFGPRFTSSMIPLGWVSHREIAASMAAIPAGDGPESPVSPPAVLISLPPRPMYLKERASIHHSLGIKRCYSTVVVDRGGVYYDGGAVD
jgi:hypothetical protein